MKKNNAMTRERAIELRKELYDRQCQIDAELEASTSELEVEELMEERVFVCQYLQALDELQANT